MGVQRNDEGVSRRDRGKEGKNLGVRKTMEGDACTTYAKSGSRSSHVSNYTEANDHGRHTGVMKGKRASFANTSLFR